ncbi:MAG: hypothetical protein ACXADX_07115, partial [Candidatus Hodarchaeales archaeon]
MIRIPSIARRKELFILTLLLLPFGTIIFSMDGIQGNPIEPEKKSTAIRSNNALKAPAAKKKIDHALNAQKDSDGRFNPPTAPDSESTPQDGNRARQPKPLEQGQDTQNFVNNVNDDHSPSDIGTYSNWAAMQSVGTVNTLTEVDVSPDTEDHYDQENSDVDSSADVGTQTTPFFANDSVNSQYMTLEETNLGASGITYLIQPSSWTSPTGMWIDIPYGYDWDNATSATAKEWVDYTDDIWWDSWNNSGSGGIIRVDIRMYLDLVGLTDDTFTIEVWVGGSQCPETVLIDSSNDTTGIEIILNDVTEPGDGTWTWPEVGNIRVGQTGAKSGGPDYPSDYQVHEVWGWVYTGQPDFELDFEYSWTAADYDEANEEVCINIETAVQASESLKAWEWTGSAWSSLGSISSDDWNNFSCSYLTSTTYCIKVNDSNQSGDGNQNSWNINLITLHVWSPSNHQFDRELGWEAVDYDEQNEELCIKTGTIGTEDLKVDVWHSGSWTNIITIADADDSIWINTSISTYLIGSVIEFRFQGGTESSDSIQNTWEIDAVLIHTWSAIGDTATEIADSSVLSGSSVDLKYGETYQWWLRWNDTETNDLIEDMAPEISDTFHVNLVGVPSEGNHTFQFNATDIGSFLISLTLDIPDYQAQTFELTFNVDTNPTTIALSQDGSSATVYLRFTDDYDFWVMWEDSYHSVSINDTAAAIEGSYTIQGALPETGNHTFNFKDAPLGTYKVNITLEATGYDAALYRIIFVVEENPTAITSSRDGSDPMVYLRHTDSYDFWVVWEDTHHSVFINDTATLIEGSYTTQGPLTGDGNHTFSFFGAPLGSHQVNITLETVGYSAIAYKVIFIIEESPTAITNSRDGASPTVYLQYTDSYDFWVIWEDINHSTLIGDGAAVIDGSYTSQGPLTGDGNHTFSFTDAPVGTYEVNITLETVGYSAALYQILFVVDNNPTAISNPTFPLGATQTVPYGGFFDFSFIWQDVNHSLPVSGASVTANTTSIRNYAIGGEYFFTFAAQALGTYRANVTLSKTGYESVSYLLSFLVIRSPTSIHSASIAEDAAIWLYFNNTFAFWVRWYDNTTRGFIDDYQVQLTGNGTTQIEFSSIVYGTGNHTFRFRGIKLGLYQIALTFENPAYVAATFTLCFEVRPRPTTPLTPEISFPDSLMAIENITGQYGWKDYGSQPVTNAQVVVFLNGTRASLAQATEVANGYYDIVILPREEVSWGYYNLTLWFGKYGFENQTITKFVDIVGVPLELELITSVIFLRGEDFVLEARLYQAALPLSSTQLLQLGSGTPVPGENVLFNVTLLLENGTLYLFTEEATTGPQGRAIAKIPGTITAQVSTILSIEATVDRSDVFQSEQIEVPPESFPPIKSAPRESNLIQELQEFIQENLLYLIVGFLGFLALTSVSGYKLWSYQKTARSTRAIERKLRDIRLLRMVIIRHRDGVRLYARSIFSAEGDLAEAIAGMSAAIGSFMEGISSHSIGGTGDGSRTGPTEFVRMEQTGLHMLQRNGVHTAVIVISEGTQGRFMEKNIQQLQEEMESRFENEFARFFTNAQIPESQLEELVAHHLYTGLLGALEINMTKFAEEQPHLSPNERHIVQELLAHREFVPSETIFLDSYMAHLEEHGIPR